MDLQHSDMISVVYQSLKSNYEILTHNMTDEVHILKPVHDPDGRAQSAQLCLHFLEQRRPTSLDSDV